MRNLFRILVIKGINWCVFICCINFVLIFKLSAILFVYRYFRHFYIKTVSTRDANRIPIKLKVVSGQYILQANRARFNQNQVDTICQLCGEEEENMEHFLLKCTILQAVRYQCIR